MRDLTLTLAVLLLAGCATTPAANLAPLLAGDSGLKTIQIKVKGLE